MRVNINDYGQVDFKPTKCLKPTDSTDFKLKGKVRIPSTDSQPDKGWIDYDHWFKLSHIILDGVEDLILMTSPSVITYQGTDDMDKSFTEQTPPKLQHDKCYVSLNYSNSESPDFLTSVGANYEIKDGWPVHSINLKSIYDLETFINKVNNLRENKNEYNIILSFDPLEIFLDNTL